MPSTAPSRMSTAAAVSPARSSTRARSQARPIECRAAGEDPPTSATNVSTETARRPSSSHAAEATWPSSSALSTPSRSSASGLDDASMAAKTSVSWSACAGSRPCEMPSPLRVCHTWSASQSKLSAAISPLRSTRPAARYRSLNGGIGSLRNAARSTSSASWIGFSPEANRNASGIATTSNERWTSSSRTARSKPALSAATWAAVAAGGASSGDHRNAPSTTSTRAQPPDNPSSQPSGPSTTSVSRPSSIQPSVSSTPSRCPSPSTSSTSSPINHQPSADSSGCIRTNPSAPSSASTRTVHAVPSTSAGTNTNPSLTSVKDVSSCNNRSRSSRPIGWCHGASNRDRNTSRVSASLPSVAMTVSRSVFSVSRAMTTMMPDRFRRASQSASSRASQAARPRRSVAGARPHGPVVARAGDRERAGRHGGQRVFPTAIAEIGDRQ